MISILDECLAKTTREKALQDEIKIIKNDTIISVIDFRYSCLLLFILPILIPLVIVFIRRKDLRRVIMVKGLMGGPRFSC